MSWLSMNFLYLHWRQLILLIFTCFAIISWKPYSSTTFLLLPSFSFQYSRSLGDAHTTHTITKVAISMLQLFIFFSLATWKDVVYSYMFLYLEQKWSEFLENYVLSGITLRLHEETKSGKSRKSNKKVYMNQMAILESNKEEKKVYVEFDMDSIPERRPFLLAKDYVYVRRSGKTVKPFQVSLSYFCSAAFWRLHLSLALLLRCNTEVQIAASRSLLLLSFMKLWYLAS